MPCMCWYEPKDRDKKIIKDLCVQLTDKIKELRKEGDPIGCEFDDVIKLLTHLYTGQCDKAFERDGNEVKEGVCRCGEAGVVSIIYPEFTVWFCEKCAYGAPTKCKFIPDE